MEPTSMSILEPLASCVIESPISCQQRREEEELDIELVRSLIALTTESSPMPSNEEMRSVDEVEFTRMREEAERDYQQWKAARKLMRLRRHDSSTSTASSSAVSPLATAAGFKQSC